MPVPSHHLTLLLKPADVALFREPRPFDAGSTDAASQFPAPQTIAGAVRNWLLNQFGADLKDFAKHARKQPTLKLALEQCIPVGHPAHWVLTASFAGPLLCDSRTGEAFLPPPLNVAAVASDPRNLYRLWPLANEVSIPGKLVHLAQNASTSSSAALPLPQFRPCWLPSSEEPRPPRAGYVSIDALTDHMLRVAGKPQQKHIHPENRFYQMEPRTGLGIDPDSRNAQQSYLYMVSFLRLNQGNANTAGYAFRVDIHTNANQRSAVKQAVQQQSFLRLGGEGRPAQITLLNTEPDIPQAPSWPPEDGRFSTYLATPGLFDCNSWYPRKMAEKFDLVGAIVQSPTTFTGWNGALNRPLPTRCAVQSGAIYYWMVPPGLSGDEKKRLEDPHGTMISDNEDDRQTGWGLSLRGDWKFA